MRIYFIILLMIVGIAHINAQHLNDGLNRDILLVINFSHPHYENIDFLKELYGPYFSDIVFFGPTEHPGVDLVDNCRGWCSYTTLGLAMEKYPHYKGYLYTNDDCIINVWNLKRFNTSKIWFTQLGHAQLRPDAIQNWGWWQMSVGYEAVVKSYAMLDDEHKLTLSKNCGNNTVLWGFSDVVYIPARYRKDVIKLYPLFAMTNTFLEIAIPTICGCLDEQKNWEILNGVTLWFEDRNYVDKYYNKNLDFLHPIKCSDEQNRFFIAQQFKTQMQ